MKDQAYTLSMGFEAFCPECDRYFNWINVTIPKEINDYSHILPHYRIFWEQGKVNLKCGCVIDYLPFIAYIKAFYKALGDMGHIEFSIYGSLRGLL